MEEPFRKWAVVSSIVKAGEKQDSRVTHTLMQKVVYLLQAALGVDTGYKFKLYYYGPYSDALWNDLRILSDLKALDIVADQNGYGYWISIANQKTVDLFSRETAEVPSNKVSDVMHLLGNESASFMELMATTHFVHSDLIKKNNRANETSVAESVTRLKPHFSTEQVVEALGILREKQWLVEPAVS